MSLIFYYHDGEESRLAVDSLEFHPEMLEILQQLGIIEIREGFIERSHLQRVYKTMRLRRGLGINLPGAAVILDLLDRIDQLQAEVESLKRGR